MKLASKVIQQQEFAQIVGISPSLVSRLITEGILRKGGTLAEWVQAFIAREVELNQSPSASAELEQERVLLTRARRQTAEANLKAQLGELIRADDVRAARAAEYGTLKTSLWNWQNSLPPQLARREAPEIAAILERELRRVLNDLTRNFNKQARLAVNWLAANAPASLWTYCTPTQIAHDAPEDEG